MSLYGFAGFCAVYLLAVATPGPGVAAVLSRSLTHGMRGAPAFIAGFLIGDLVWFAGASAGLAALAQTAQSVFLVVRYAGALYLTYLAYRLWTAPIQPLEAGDIRASQRPWRLFLGSLSLTLGNPKPMIFFVALLPTVVHLRALHFEDYLLIAMAILGHPFATLSTPDSGVLSLLKGNGFQLFDVRQILCTRAGALVGNQIFQ